MASWELAGVARLVQGETPRAVTALQPLESVNGHTRRACCKLKQSRFAFCGPAADALPEPGYDLVVLFVPTIVGKLDPVVP